MGDQQAEHTPDQPVSAPAGAGVPPSSEQSSEACAPDAGTHESPVILAASEPENPTSRSAAGEAAPPTSELARSYLAKFEGSRALGGMFIRSPGDRAWHAHRDEAVVDEPAPQVKPDIRVETAPKPSRGHLVTAVMLVLATLSGAIGGALATTGFTRVAETAAPASAGPTVEASIARIDADILALKSGLEHNSKAGVSQFNKTSDRLDKIEKAQAEPGARLAKLTEAVDKLRAASAAPAVPVAVAAAANTKDITGSVPATPTAPSIAPPPSVPAAAPLPKAEIARLPTVEGWTLADAGYGSALIRSRRGTFEVYAGDVIPGLGRIDAVRKQDGQWVVVTSKGLIVQR